MAFFETFGVVFMAIMFLIFALVLFLRFAKYGTVLGSLADTFSGGYAIIDKSGKGDIAELVGWDQHPETKLIRIRLNYVDKFIQGQSPYIFQEEDFEPHISTWENYAGTIICYYDFERRHDYRDISTLNLTKQIKQLKEQSKIYKKMGKEFLEYFEGQKLNEAKIAENVHGAKMLKTIKSVVEEANVDDVSGSDKGDPMFD